MTNIEQELHLLSTLIVSGDYIGSPAYLFFTLKAILALIERQVAEARLDEVLMMRTAGSEYANQEADVTFQGLCTVYDNHILKRAADLTVPLSKSNTGALGGTYHDIEGV